MVPVHLINAGFYPPHGLQGFPEPQDNPLDMGTIDWNFCCSYFYLILFFFFKNLLIHERQREKQAPCREPDVGLNPWIRDYALS